jgi:hypothetical protein
LRRASPVSGSSAVAFQEYVFICRSVENYLSLALVVIGRVENIFSRMKLLGLRASIADFGGIREAFFTAVTLVPHLVPPPV